MSVMIEERPVTKPVAEYIPPRVLRGTTPAGQHVAVMLWDETSGEVRFSSDGVEWGLPIEVSTP